MDEIKLDRWREQFQLEARNIEMEYNAFFRSQTLKEVCTMTLDESNEWKLLLADGLPAEIKERLLQCLVATKPEDSI